MLWALAAILIILWVIGIVSACMLGGLVHILLALAIVIIIRLIQGWKVNYDKAIEALQRKHDEAGRHLSNLKAASDEGEDGTEQQGEAHGGSGKVLTPGIVQAL